MKNISILVCFLLAGLFLSGCATQVMPTQYTYGEDEIRVHLKADPQLNLYEGRPHTLLVCVYQLSDPNAFNQFSGSMDGMYKLLECDRFDSSVTNAERLIIHPGKDGTFTISRAEGSKYIAILAGYYYMQKEHISRLFPVPIVTKTKGFFSKTKTSKPAAMLIDLELGPQQIKSAIESSLSP